MTAQGISCSKQPQQPEALAQRGCCVPTQGPGFATLKCWGTGRGGASGWVSCIPDSGVKLKGEDDVMVLADLADEAALGAQVTVVDMLGGKLDQGLEESFIHSLRDL